MNLDVSNKSIVSRKVFKPGGECGGYGSAIYPVKSEPTPPSASHKHHTLAALTTGHEGNLRKPFSSSFIHI